MVSKAVGYVLDHIDLEGLSTERSSVLPTGCVLPNYANVITGCNMPLYAAGPQDKQEIRSSAAEALIQWN